VAPLIPLVVPRAVIRVDRNAPTGTTYPPELPGRHQAGRRPRLPAVLSRWRPRLAGRVMPGASGCHSACHSTRHHSARQERTGWTTLPTRPARTALSTTPWTIRCCLVIRCPPARTGLRASDLPAAAPHTASQRPISLSSMRPATCSSIGRSVVPRCLPKGPTIDGKDGVAGSIPAEGSTLRLTSANAGEPPSGAVAADPIH
jgi:hypothetical protein